MHLHAVTSHPGTAAGKRTSRTAALLAAAAIVAALQFASAAQAATTTTVNCGGLEAAIGTANPGDTIILSDPSGPCTAGTLVPANPAVAFPLIVTTDNLTIEGDPAAAVPQGLDGTGTNGGGFGGPPALVGGNVDGLTLQGLTIGNFQSATAAVVVLWNQPFPAALTHPFTISGDNFSNDVSAGQGGPPGSGGGGALAVFLGDPSGPAANCGTSSITLSGSTFEGDGVTFNGPGAFEGGGGAALVAGCTAPIPVTVSDNTFQGNFVNLAGGGEANGGGLFVLGPSLTQSGNDFTGNSLQVSGPACSAQPCGVDGGGELIFTQGPASSTGDVYEGNAATAIASSGANSFVSQGGGLAAVALAGSPTCTTPVPLTLTNDVVAGNILSGAPERGDGIGVGLPVPTSAPISSCPVALTLQDSTVTANTGAPVGGISGLVGSTLSSQNSIVEGNSSPDVSFAASSSFASDPSLVTSSFSDLCALGHITAFAGTGNICANPQLVGGLQSIYDVHETPQSPTIDAGSNALVPGGLSTDVFGSPRLVASLPGTTTPTVDIGAVEFQGPTTVTTPGSAGPVGPAGPTGPAGTGSTGPAGPAGPTGPAGTGSPGPAGPTGIGATGPTGLAGTGFTGPAGATGPAGKHGKHGKKGKKGKKGKSKPIACKTGVKTGKGKGKSKGHQCASKPPSGKLVLTRARSRSHVQT